MNFQHTHPLQPYWDLALASVQSGALVTALDIDLFSALSEQASAEEIAARFNLDPRKLGHVLELLSSMDLLELTPARVGEKVTSRYRVSSNAKQYFLKSSPDYCGDAWAFRLRSLREFGTQLPAHLQRVTDKETTPSPKEPTDQCWATLARTTIVQEQTAITAKASLAVVSRLPELIDTQHFLELGGGPGMVAIALAQLLPKSHGTVFELPPTAAVAKQNIGVAQLDARLSVVGGDLTQDDIGHDYDLIWCASVLHFVPDLTQTLRKIRAALLPGGLFVAIHAEIPVSATQAATVLAYYLPLLLRGHRVGRQGELTEALLAAGFNRVETFESDQFPLAPVQVLVCQ